MERPARPHCKGWREIIGAVLQSLCLPRGQTVLKKGQSFYKAFNTVTDAVGAQETINHLN